MVETASVPPGLAVDIGGTTTRVAVVQGARLLERREMPTDAQAGPDDLFGRLLTLIAAFTPSYTTRPIGVAWTGRVTAVNQATMPGWTDLPLQRWLENALQAPICLLEHLSKRELLFDRADL